MARRPRTTPARKESSRPSRPGVVGCVVPPPVAALPCLPSPSFAELGSCLMVAEQWWCMGRGLTSVCLCVWLYVSVRVVLHGSVVCCYSHTCSRARWRRRDGDSNQRRRRLCTTLRFPALTVCVSGCPSPSVLCSRNAESWGSHIVVGMVQVTEHVCVHRHRSSSRQQEMGTLPRWSASSPPGPTSITGVG